MKSKYRNSSIFMLPSLASAVLATPAQASASGSFTSSNPTPIVGRPVYWVNAPETGSHYASARGHTKPVMRRAAKARRFSSVASDFPASSSPSPFTLTPMPSTPPTPEDKAIYRQRIRDAAVRTQRLRGVRDCTKRSLDELACFPVEGNGLAVVHYNLIHLHLETARALAESYAADWADESAHCLSRLHPEPETP